MKVNVPSDGSDHQVHSANVEKITQWCSRPCCRGNKTFNSLIHSGWHDFANLHNGIDIRVVGHVSQQISPCYFEGCRKGFKAFKQ